ncbi:MAG: CPBP family intramembrane glutamic endopeptidase [Lachnospiraceae bacterium]|jgi:membrane protease YdiL (CAAX protease family)
MNREKNPGTKSIWLYLILITVFWTFSFVTLNLWLKSYSVAFQNTGQITAGYLAYAVIGMLFTTPAPFLSVFILSIFREKMSLRAFFAGLVRTEKKFFTIALTAVFCLMALAFALFRGIPNGSPWYMMPLGFLVMIPFVGIAEEAGWRGFLQPALEKRMKFPFSVILVAVIWDVWHIDLWLDPTSNHYGDSFIGFTITIFVWAFALAALYKATKSVMACAVYHAFVDAIGGIFDWNALFDAFPGDIYVNIYRVVLLVFSVVLWIFSNRRSRKEFGQNGDRAAAYMKQDDCS